MESKTSMVKKKGLGKGAVAVASAGKQGVSVKSVMPQTKNQKPVKSIQNQTTDFVTILQKYINVDMTAVDNMIDAVMNHKYPMAEVSVPIEVVDFLISNAAYVLSAWIISEEARRMTADAIATELDLETMTVEQRYQARKNLNQDKLWDSSGSIILGMTKFTDDFAFYYQSKWDESFTKIQEFDVSLTEDVKSFSEENKKIFGFIINHFLYFLRACSKNEKFRKDFFELVNIVKDVANS